MVSREDAREALIVRRRCRVASGQILFLLVPLLCLQSTSCNYERTRELPGTTWQLSHCIPPTLQLLHRVALTGLHHILNTNTNTL
jgi:hypothetical protein